MDKFNAVLSAAINEPRDFRDSEASGAFCYGKNADSRVYRREIRRFCENGTPIAYRESKKGFSVHYSGRVIGYIVSTLGGFQYVTREGDRGDVFPLVRDVMRSLEEC